MIAVHVHWLLCWMVLSMGMEKAPVEASFYQIDFQTTFHVMGPTQLIRYTLLLPQDINEVQEVTKLAFSPQPKRIYEKHGNKYAEFRIQRPKIDFKVHLHVQVKTKATSLRKTLSPKRSKSYVPEVGSFLEASVYQESSHPDIKRLASQLKQKNPEKTIRAIYRFVQDTLEYKPKLDKDLGAISALQQGIGDCTEFSDLFVALCRASGIPARTVSGWLLQENIKNPNHHWVEVWINQEWRKIDPSISEEDYLMDPYPGIAYLLLSPLRIDRVCKTSNDRWVATSTGNGKVAASYQYKVKKL
ncbi:MAG: transglutaminase domain-containing protein [Bacteroidota bacterium]